MVKKVFFIFFLVFFLGFSLAYNFENLNTDSLEAIPNSETGTINYFPVEDGTTFSFGEEFYFNVGEESLLEFDSSGELTKATLVASDKTSWTFDDRKYSLEKGQILTYEFGNVKISGAKGEKFSYEDSFGSSEIEFFESFGSVYISNKGDITGRFHIGEVFVDGKVSDITEDSFLVEEGNIFAENVNIDFSKPGKVYFKESLAFHSEKNAIGFFENKFLVRSQGLEKEEAFYISFAEGNPYALIEQSDIFDIGVSGNSKFTIENRDSLNKIPLIDVETASNTVIFQDSRRINIASNKVSYEPHKISGAETATAWTSPVELQISGSENSYLINNFKGIAIVPQGQQEGYSDIRFQNSIYKQKATTDLRFNYPTKEDFERFTDRGLVFSGDLDTFVLDNPVNIRRLLDFYETLPDETANSFSRIVIYDEDSFEEKKANTEGLKPYTYAFFDSADKSIHLQSNEKIGQNSLTVPLKDFGIFQHEFAHSAEDNLQYGTEFREYWFGLNEHPYGNSLLDTKKLSVEQKHVWADGSSGPSNGFASPYGSTSIGEDIAEHVRLATTEPTSFTEKKLLYNSDGSLTTYHEKILALKDLKMISEEQYQAIIRPDKEGLLNYYQNPSDGKEIISISK